MTEPLIVNALYNRFGMTLIAIDETHLVLVMTTDNVKHEATDEHKLIARPGTEAWVIHMVNLRDSLARDLHNERAELRSKDTWIENLGDAIRDKAIEHDWCSEYDEFAEEWDLPKREYEYDVSMTIRVTARDSDAAVELVVENFSLGSYGDDVVEGPEYHAEKVI